MIRTNRELDLARRLIEYTGVSVFLTGKAGTGKTTFLRNLVASSHKRIIVTAPTGIAAINAGGVTLHSFFQLDFAPFIPGVSKSGSRQYHISKEKRKIIRGMDLLIIDEVSMVRADLLDAVDATLRRFRDRRKPFGGVQLLLIGDLRQLAPVVKESEQELLAEHYPSNYFFDSHALRQLPMHTVALTEVFRQSDQHFLDILNAIRDNKATPSILQQLNSRYHPGFNPSDEEGYIRLTTHNYQANMINANRMDQLDTEPVTFEATVEGNFPENSYPAEEQLTLKVGAQVMFIKNDTGFPRAYYNGMLGTIVAIDREQGVAVLPNDGGEIINVQYATWENVSYTVDTESNQIKEKHEGSFSQIPLRPAWAVTIHKSQGLTFDRAIIDARNAFAHGQTYVALSRCRTLEGIVLENPIIPSAIMTDAKVTEYLQATANRNLDSSMVENLENQYRVTLLDEMFAMQPVMEAMELVGRVYTEYYMKTSPQTPQNWDKLYNQMQPLAAVAEKFRLQYWQLAMGGAEKLPHLSQRVKDASKYFLSETKILDDMLKMAPRRHENKRVEAKVQERVNALEELVTLRRTLLKAFTEHDFDINEYLEMKAQAILRKEIPTKSAKTKRSKSKPTTPPPLYEVIPPA